jgi:glycosyltransferase involved in cell wall biosynthesis
LRGALHAAPDLFIVGFRAHSDVLLASLIARARGVPLIFDPLTSRYEERVIDRQQVSAGSWLASWYRLTDRAGCLAADRLLLETDAQIDYFVETFGVAREKCRRLWLGADETVMRPQTVARRDGRFTVFFYGRFSPLHGIEHIVDAASLLEQRGEEVRFLIVGAGQTYASIRERAAQRGVSTLTFMEPVPHARLAELMSAADVCLGTFGTAARARRVIPYKVFDALAVSRPVITADTPAIREALEGGTDVLTCASGDGQALADAIATLKHDPSLRERLAANGHRVFMARFSAEALTSDLAAIVGELAGGGRAHPVPR